ncbi:MAG TPA: hypothetical protein VF653_04915 [Methylomirabilota bacterium]
MPELPADVTLDEVRERARLAGLPIPEARLSLVRGFLVNALRPIRALDSRTVRMVEPAVTFRPLGDPPRAGSDRTGGTGS